MWWARAWVEVPAVDDGAATGEVAGGVEAVLDGAGLTVRADDEVVGIGDGR